MSTADLTPFLTNTFMHGGFLHIILNLWTLYIFGPALEDRLGPARFLALYLAAGIIASVAHAVFNAFSAIPALGASGAIAGVIGAYAVRFPYAWVRVLVPIIIFPLFFSIPAMLFAGIWFLMQVHAGHQRAVPARRWRRHCLVGAHRRLPRRTVSRAAARAGLRLGCGRRTVGQP